MFVYVSMYMIICMFVFVYIYRSQVLDLLLGHYAISVITERAHRQYIYLFIYYLFIYTLFYVDIYNKKHKNSDLYNSLYTNSYTNGIQCIDIHANLCQPK